MTTRVHPQRETGSTPSPGDPSSTHVTPRRSFFSRLALLLAGGATFPVATALAARAADPDFCIVRPRDTLSEIAERHGVTVAQLRALNGIKTDHIRPGQRLRLRGPAEYALLAPVRSRIAVRNLNGARWRHIILHHSATASGNAAVFDRYHRERRHMENGLAYHFIIGNGSQSADGQVEVGSRWTRQINGGHVRSLALNENSIGICLVGNFEVTSPTRKQVAACIELVGFLKLKLLGDRPDILFHRELHGEHTLCPGRNFPANQFARFRA